MVQGALEAREQIKVMLSLSKRSLEREILKLESHIDEMDISTNKVEACMELESLKEQLEHEKRMEKEVDMEIGDVLSPNSPLFDCYTPELITDDMDMYSRPYAPPGDTSRQPVTTTIRSGNATYTRSAPPFQYGPGSSIATASAELNYKSPGSSFGSSYTFGNELDIIDQDELNGLDDTADSDTVASGKWKEKWAPGKS